MAGKEPIVPAVWVLWFRRNQGRWPTEPEIQQGLHCGDLTAYAALREAKRREEPKPKPRKDRVLFCTACGKTRLCSYQGPEVVGESSWYKCGCGKDILWHRLGTPVRRDPLAKARKPCPRLSR